eukprot:gnl/TRDRNA2_/TRDRNA2_156590_c0_seq3.p1 gnl/TRDRNA2_/TRDRNA2_156590_c0~~gnl/TRDRNA2_/TRDRNA2_156590_c0_seq3.p1  ORF type:complete len:293 (+),score=13.96 gnl/TRDRNA2_/TRDRNA2_156590_c0_seq3:68-946(+)
MFSSSNLVEWNHTCHFTLWNDRECPDLFELPVDGGAEGERRWVFFAGGGTYLVGQLRNDSCFEPLVDKESRRGRRAEWGNGWATQTFNDEPRGRVVQISWMMNCVYPKMRFNQQMSFPMELRLRDSPTGPYLVRRPVEELTLLRLPGRPLINISQSGLAQIGKANPARCFGHAFEFEVHVSLRLRTSAFSLHLPGHGTVALHRGTGGSKYEMHFNGRSAPLHVTADGDAHVLVLTDTASVELFDLAGEASMACCTLMGSHPHSLWATVNRGVILNHLTAYQLVSSWGSELVT